MLYNTTNGRAYNNSTTCCTTNLPHRNARAQHLDMSRWGDVANFVAVGGEFVLQQVVELLRARPLVVLCNMSVAGVRVVEFGTKQLENSSYLDRHPYTVGCRTWCCSEVNWNSESVGISGSPRAMPQCHTAGDANAWLLFLGSSDS